MQAIALNALSIASDPAAPKDCWQLVEDLCLGYLANRMTLTVHSQRSKSLDSLMKAQT